MSYENHLHINTQHFRLTDYKPPFPLNPQTEEQKERMKIRKKAYYEAHKEEVKIQRKAYYETHKEEVKARKKLWMKRNPDKVKAQKKAYREAHPEKRKESAQRKEYYKTHKEEAIARGKAYREAHPEKRKAWKKAWRAAHLEHVKAQNKAWKEAHPDKVKAYDEAWKEAYPEKVKARNARRREMGYEPLNAWFSGCHGHHICDPYVIYIPEELHIKYLGHNHNKPETMIEVNKAAWEFFESQNKGQTKIVPEMRSDLEILKLKTTARYQQTPHPVCTQL